MNAIRPGLSAIAAACALIACSPGSEDSAQAIIDHHVSAVGGAAALDAIGNVNTRVLIEEATFTVEGDYRATADGLMRIDIYADGERVFSEGVDDEGSWQMGGDGEIKPSSEKGEQALRNGVEFNLVGLHRFAERGHTVAYDGDEVVDGVSYKVLKVTLVNGFETWLYFNPETWMNERRRDVRALHPDVNADERLFETFHSDFVKTCGVLSPNKSEQIDMSTGDVVQTATVQTRACNLPESELRISRYAE